LRRAGTGGFFLLPVTLATARAALVGGATALVLPAVGVAFTLTGSAFALPAAAAVSLTAVGFTFNYMQQAIII